MKRLTVLFIILTITPVVLHSEIQKLERIGITLDGVNGVLGEAQLDCSMKFGSFEFSLKPGLRLFYLQESGPPVKGRGFSLRPSFNHYITRSLYFGLVIPVVCWLDPPNLSFDVNAVLRTGVAPIFGWKCALGILLLSVELGFGVGAQQIWFENPWAYVIEGWFATHAQLGVGLAFPRKRENRE